MRFLILVCAVLATVSAAPNTNQEAANKSAQKFKEVETVCNEDPATRIDFEALKKAHDEGKHEKPANSGPHALCISKKLGWQKADGSVDVELIRSRISAVFSDTAKVEEFITECTQASGSEEEVAETILHCYLKNRPHGPGPRH